MDTTNRFNRWMTLIIYIYIYIKRKMCTPGIPLEYKVYLQGLFLQKQTFWCLLQPLSVTTFNISLSDKSWSKSSLTVARVIRWGFPFLPNKPWKTIIYSYIWWSKSLIINLFFEWTLGCLIVIKAPYNWKDLWKPLNIQAFIQLAISIW